MRMIIIYKMKQYLLTGILASSLIGCGTTNNYIVVQEPEPAIAMAQDRDWDLDEQFTAMFKYLGCISFGQGEIEPVCYEIRKLVQACADYNEQSGIGSGIDLALDKTCSNIVTIDWVTILQNNNI